MDSMGRVLGTKSFIGCRPAKSGGAFQGTIARRDHGRATQCTRLDLREVWFQTIKEATQGLHHKKLQIEPRSYDDLTFNSHTLQMHFLWQASAGYQPCWPMLPNHETAILSDADKRGPRRFMKHPSIKAKES